MKLPIDKDGSTKLVNKTNMRELSSDIMQEPYRYIKLVEGKLRVSRVFAVRFRECGGSLYQFLDYVKQNIQPGNKVLPIDFFTSIEMYARAKEQGKIKTGLMPTPELDLFYGIEPERENK